MAALTTTTKKEVRAPRALLRTETTLSLVQTKVMRAFMMLSWKDDGMLSGEYEMPIATFRSLLDLHNYEVMKASLNAIRGKTLDWPVDTEGDEGWVTPVPSCVWNEKKGVIRWEISRTFARLCSSVNTNGYIYLPWDILTKFSSVYALRIWELCMSSVKSNGYGSETPKWTYEVLRLKLGVPADAYQTTAPAQVVAVVVKKPLMEVNEIGGLEVEFCKRGRAQNAVYWFVIKGSKPAQGLLGEMTGISSQVKRLNAAELRERIVAALAAAPSEKRTQIEREMPPSPTDENALRSYKAELRNYDVEVV